MFGGGKVGFSQVIVGFWLFGMFFVCLCLGNTSAMLACVLNVIALERLATIKKLYNLETSTIRPSSNEKTIRQKDHQT